MSNNNTVKILKVGHALVQGDRGARGGAPSKDSIWGLALINNNLVKFYGRRGGKLRFKTERRANMDSALGMFYDKVNGRGMNYSYRDLDEQAQEELVPGLAEQVKTGFYRAMAARTLNTNSTRRFIVE